MSSRTPPSPGFKRQVVVRLDAEQWPLLERAVSKHGSIQAAVVEALRALADLADEAPEPQETSAKTPERGKSKEETPDGSPSQEQGEEEITAREAADLLNLKPGTVRGYIRSGRLPGRYDGEPDWRGWFTTRKAVDAYRSRS
jgi:hypothetical protein